MSTREYEQLNMRVTLVAHEAWTEYAHINGVTLSALGEACGRHFAAGGGLPEEIVVKATEIRFQRTRRGRRRST